MPLWYVDRSRFETGAQECSWKRYLGYHFGPSGYGIARKAQSLPLATGLGVHAGGEGMGRWALAHPEAREIPLEVIRATAAEARRTYETSARESGIAGFADEARVEEIIGEQSALIGGLIWCEGLEFWPWLLERYQVVDVESEETLVLDCTCALGDRIGVAADHEARGCSGICFMSRPDLLTRSRTRMDSHQYWERKSTSYVSQAWQEQWETKIQFHAGVVAAEARLGIRIDETFVIGLMKGARKQDKAGVKRQGSVLCYGFKQEANPPLYEEKWAAEYEFVKADGSKGRLGPKYQKTPIWTAQFEGELDPIEYWVRWIPAAVRQQQVAIVGPFNRQEVLIEGFLRDLIPHERQWQAACWLIYQALEAAGWDWSQADAQVAIGQQIQRSWACRKFGAEHECPMKMLCFQHEGWQDPLAHGYVLRRPHHDPELQAALAAGVIPPEVAVEGEEE
jgi:hypothetical protein